MWLPSTNKHFFHLRKIEQGQLHHPHVHDPNEKPEVDRGYLPWATGFMRKILRTVLRTSFSLSIARALGGVAFFVAFPRPATIILSGFPGTNQKTLPLHFLPCRFMK
jgi:hypothetical protein